VGEKKLFVKNGEFAGTLWMIGRLFSVGFCHLGFAKALLVLAIGESQAGGVRGLMAAAGFTDLRFHADLVGRDRVLTGLPAGGRP